MAASQNAAYMFVDVDFNGKLHKNANYVQGCSVEDAYLRWVPLCGAKENKKRKASIHMVLTLGDGSPLDVDAGAHFPTTIERVTFVSGGAWAEHCPICARLAEPTPREELLSFHRRENPPVSAAEPEPSAAPSRRNKKEEAGAPSSSQAEDTSAPDKDQADSVDVLGPSEEAKQGPPEPAGSPPLLDSLAASLECQHEASPSERQDEAQPPPTPTGLAMRAAPPATPSSAAVQGSPLRAEEALDASADSIEVRSLAFMTPSRTGPLASPSIREVEEELAGSAPGDSGRRKPELDAQAVAQQLAGLSLIVRDLASAVKETSASVAELRQVVANDHALLQQHLQDAREDRQVMLGLLKALSQERGLEPSVG